MFCGISGDLKVALIGRLESEPLVSRVWSPEYDDEPLKKLVLTYYIGKILASIRLLNILYWKTKDYTSINQ